MHTRMLHNVGVITITWRHAGMTLTLPLVLLPLVLLYCGGGRVKKAYLFAVLSVCAAAAGCSGGGRTRFAAV